jgi:hypothetical protein
MSSVGNVHWYNSLKSKLYLKVPMMCHIVLSTIVDVLYVRKIIIPSVRLLMVVHENKMHKGCWGVKTLTMGS